MRTRYERAIIITLLSIAIPALTLSGLTAGSAIHQTRPANLGGFDRTTSGSTPESPTLTTILNADGSIKTAAGASGSFAASGYRMEYTATGAPRFMRATAAGCGDERWASQFNPRGTNEDIFALAVSGTDIYVGGAFVAAGNQAANFVAKFNTTTGTWSVLGSGTQNGVNGQVNSLAVLGTDVYVGGFFTTAGGVSASRIAKFDTTTNTWSALGSGVSGGSSITVNALAVIGNDLYVGGQFTTAGGGAASNIARWNLATSTWSAVTSGVNNGTLFPGVRALAVSGTDLYVGGGFSVAGGVTANNVAKWNGSSWSALVSSSNNGVSDTAFALAVSGTDVYIGGRFLGPVGTFIVKWDGSNWSALPGYPSSDITAVRVIGSDVYAGGTGGSFDPHLAKWNGSTWSALGSGIVTGTTGPQAFAVVGDNLYVAGRIIAAGGLAVGRIAKWNLTASTWSILSDGNGIGGFSFSSNVVAVSGTDVYVGSPAYSAGPIVPSSSITRLGVVKWDSVTNTWATLGGDDISITVRALAINGSEVYAGGVFTTIGGVSANNIAKWNGSAWSALGSGISGGSSPGVTALAISGNDIYVGGSFTSAGGVPVNNIAKYNTTTNTWSALGSGISGGSSPIVNALAVSGSDLFVGGGFTSAGGVSVSNIARWNTATNTWSSLGSGTSSGVDPRVQALAVSGSDLYAGGGFATAGGVTVNGIAKWNGSTWSALGSGIATNGIVNALLVNSGNLLVGGSFTTAGGITVNNVAKWNGSAWLALGSGMSAANSQILSFAAMGNDIYMAGFFALAGNKPALGIARYSDATVIWSGATSSDWHTATNWVGGVVPSSTDDVVLPATGVTNEPTISADVNLCTLSLATGRSLTISGSGNLTITTTLYLQGNNITVSNSNPVTMGANANIVRTSGYILGALNKIVSGPGNFLYPVGTANGYSPVTINFDSGAGDFTVSATQSGMSGLDAAHSLQRYWTLTSNGITQADITVQYLQTDVPASAAEGSFVFYRKSGASLTDQGITSRNTTSNTATLNDVTQFSDWTLGEPLTLVANGATIVTGSCGTPATAAIDPGEVVTVNFGVLNSGGINSGNLTATLQATGGVSSPSAPQNYGVLTAGGGSATRAFTFIASSLCGNTLTATLNLSDGIINKSITYSFTVGTINLTTFFTENFDGVTQPALPTGWQTATTGTAVAPATTNVTPDTSPNAVRWNGNTTASSSSLISPSIPIPAGSGFTQLTFRHTYNFESNASNAFDGAVLEVSTDGGANFNDAISGTVGGTFITGGYTRTLSTGFSNPLAGRQAWSGAQATYASVTINFPATLPGNVIFRWRAGWDSSTANASPNWRVDSVTFSAANCAACTTAKVWTGSADSDWHNPANWSGASLPAATDAAFIPISSVANEPHINTTDVTITTLQLGSTRTLTIGNGRALTVTGNATVNGVVNVIGNINITGTSDLSGSTFNYTGTGAQTLAILSFNNLTVNNPAGVTLNGDTLVSGALTLTNGMVNTGSNTLMVSACNGSAIAGGSDTSYINGKLQRCVNANDSYTFPVGANGYSPVILENISGTGTFTASATQSFMNGLDTTKSLQRFWTLTPSGLTQANITVQYPQADVPVTANESAFVFFRKSGATTTNQGITSLNTNTNTATLNNVTQFSDWTLGEPSAPTEINLISFQATAFAEGTLLEWQTGFETHNLGFRVYREENGKRTLVNRQLIAGSALTTGARTILESGEVYSWLDNWTAKGAIYWLEDVDLRGTSSWHGPFYAVASSSPMSPYKARLAKTLSQLNDRQAQVDTSKVESRVTPTTSRTTTAQAAQQDLLSAQAEIKIAVKQDAWYRLSAGELFAAGLSRNVDARFLQMWVDGAELPIIVSTNVDGHFDDTSSIDFYGRGLDTRLTDTRIYYLTTGASLGKRIPQVQEAGAPSAAPSFTQTVERRDRFIYFAGLLNGDEENFFGALIAADPVDQTLTLPHLYQAASQPASLEIVLQGVSGQGHHVDVQLNGSTLGSIDFSGHSPGRATFSIPHALLQEGANTVRFTASEASDISLVNYLHLSYQHTFVADDNELILTAQARDQVIITGFTSKTIHVFDVTNPDAPQALIGNVTQTKPSSYAITVAASQTGMRRLLLLTDEKIAHPSSIKFNYPSALKQAAGANFVILTRRDFFPAMASLKQARQKQNFKVEVVDVEDVYDEFSFGQKSLQAVRDFLWFARNSWKIKPRFLLMVGDASFDPRNYLGAGETDLVPTQFVETAFFETASDDWVSDFNNDGIADIASGRLPTRTLEETVAVINKIVRYEEMSVEPLALLVSDANEGFDFEQASAQVRSVLQTRLRVDEIKRGQLDAATAKTQLLQAIQEGRKIINYNGHGSVGLWRGNLLLSNEARMLTNETPPFFVMMTCLNGFFIDVTTDSLAEALMKAEGGAIAVWASSGLCSPPQQAQMNEELYRMLVASEGAPLTLGEASLRAKAVINDPDIRRTWILFADPTLKLK